MSSRLPVLSKAQRKEARTVAYGHLVACYFHTLAFLTWLVVGLVANAESNKNLLEITLELDAENELPSYDLFWTAVWVPLIAALFHALQYHSFSRLFKQQNQGRFDPALVGLGFGLYPEVLGTLVGCPLSLFLDMPISAHAYDSVINGVNKIRWIEYSISASFLTWNVVVLSGIVNVWAALVIAVLGNVVLQYTGYRTEKALSTAYSKEKKKDRYLSAFRDGGKAWLWFIIGFLVFAAQWIPTIVVFYQSVEEAEEASNVVPDFVFALIWIIFGLYLLFPLVFVFFYLFSIGERTFYSISFIVLSFVSKAALDAIIIIGAITERED